MLLAWNRHEARASFGAGRRAPATAHAIIASVLSQIGHFGAFAEILPLYYNAVSHLCPAFPCYLRYQLVNDSNGGDR